MAIEISALVMIISVVFLLVFLIFFLVTFILFLKWLRRPRVCYAPVRIEDYMCPKCGSKELDLVSVRTLRCRKCGTIFTLRAAYEERWIIWPFFWWFPIMIPIPLKKGS